ncbi:MAG: YdcF family protein [Gammaproteobacteria bacterium]|nr:YdcF family protein [Gammaproteobacteria bacterium]
MIGKRRRRWMRSAVIVALAFVLLITLFGMKALTAAGRFLVVNDSPIGADAVVVLLTGVDIYPRLMEAARLYQDGRAKVVVINGNRKSPVLRQLESQGFERCCKWDEDFIRILEVLGVPRNAIMSISAEDAFDTVSEAKVVGSVLVEAGFEHIVVSTSPFHTRRARHIWLMLYGGELTVDAVAASSDPFRADGWWKEGRQIRSVLGEYGGWLFYYWQRWKE